MGAIPKLLQSYRTDFQYHLPLSGIDLIIDPNERSEGPGTTLVGRSSTADGLDWPNTSMPCANERMEGYRKNDAVDADSGEEADRVNKALIYQRAVRRHTPECIEETPRDIERNRLFTACKASANTVHVRYREIYLGPVPHLLLCLGWIATRAQASMNIPTIQRTDSSVQGLSDLTDQQKRMRFVMKHAPASNQLIQYLSGIFDEACRLQKSLEPGSHLHPKENLGNDTWHIEPLRNAVMKTRDLFELFSDPEAPSDDFEAAWNGIMSIKLQERDRY